MKTVFIAAFALTAAAAPLSAANLNLDLEGLTIAQQAQVFGIENSDENGATKERLIEAVLVEANATDASVAAARQAQVFGVENSDDNGATKERLIEAILSESNATDATVAAAQIRFIEESEDNGATRTRHIDAVRN